MEPPRLSLVPSSQDVNDNAPDDTGAPEALGGLPRNVAALPFADHREKLRILEALLFAAAEPLDEAKLEIAPRRDRGYRRALEELQGLLRRPRRQSRARRRQVGVPHRARIWPTCSSATPSQERRLSKAALETLAIIAYHQPVTRAEIEEIRGVTTSEGTLDILLETGWVRLRGRRRAPGRPVTYGTTEPFLEPFRAREHQGPARARRAASLGPARRQPAARFLRAGADRHRRADAG